MSCYTSFNFSSPTSQVSHRDMECSEAFRMTSQLRNEPDEYLTHVTITKKIGLFRKRTETYDFLSHKKFLCLLKCAADTRNESEYIKCNTVCLEILDPIKLNQFDRQIGVTKVKL